MIQAHELRIGNYVVDNFDVHKPYQLTKISLDDFVAISNGCNSYQPIPLTEEILLKCGFEENGQYLAFKNIRLYIYHSRFNSEYFIFDFGMMEKFTEIQYLHQLQNLYFALTGEELEVKL